MLGKRFLFVVAGVLVLAFVVAASNPSRLYAILVSSDKLLILAAFAVSNLAVLTRIIKWRVLIDVPLRRIAPVQLMGIAVGNFTPGKAAEPIKAVALRLKTGIPVSQSLNSIIWERMLDVLVIIVFSSGAFLLIAGGSKIFFLGVVGVVILSAAVIFGAFVLLSRKTGTRIIFFLMRFPVFRRFPKNFPELFYSKKISARRIFASLLFTVITWIAEGVILKYSLLAAGVELPLLVSVGIVSLSVAVGFASLLPGGIGSTEAVMVVLLVAAGIPADTAALGALLSRFLSFWYSNMLGAVSLFYFRNLSGVINARSNGFADA